MFNVLLCKAVRAKSPTLVTDMSEGVSFSLHVVHALNKSNTLLITFIVDPFGGLGPITNCFLFGLRPDPGCT
jgi:hypothetical protein